jgi:hypothetical protein
VEEEEVEVEDKKKRWRLFSICLDSVLTFIPYHGSGLCVCVRVT